MTTTTKNHEQRLERLLANGAKKLRFKCDQVMEDMEWVEWLKAQGFRRELQGLRVQSKHFNGTSILGMRCVFYIG